ncbi:thioesterase II family protein [Streptomyces alkaliterrae]|uniref:Alpha/beta fold hydrolase n=1 Tax=Streptomyces alkaliterrae TaxID=2213162 RepID=A0A5P0YWT5_9ACTN|nr:alpha/beta fold hydrolase [Streptomyces alkaliterrae]MBB1257458.1 thioesterase [Streptomyces alkaliterrae]MQS02959.1 alpha/beta fold hydrolase [Streptomyces alkaliterrae]
MSSEPPNPWLRRYFPRPGAGRRVVFFPHGGGSASFYRPLVRELPDGVEGVVVQYPGREDRIGDPCRTDMPGLVEPLAEALTELDDKPVWFFGHSMGASVAHEVTRLLGRAGEAVPERLVVSGRPGPSRQRPDDKHLDDERLWADVCQLGGTDPQLLQIPGVREMTLPVLRADYRLVGTYRPEPGRHLSVPVSVCYGTEDPEVDTADAAAWAEVTSAHTELVRFPGGHFYLRGTARAEFTHWLARRLHGRSQHSHADTAGRNRG